jgi:pentapeptide MXKDX repeat protein
LKNEELVRAPLPISNQRYSQIIFRTLALATAIAITATGYAFAQNSGNPAEPAGSKASDSSSSGTMAKDKVAKDKMKSGTTGAGMAADEASGKSNGPKSSGSVSPASPNAGAKQEK